MSASSPKTPVSPHVRRVRRANLSPHGNFGGEPNFEAAVIRLPSGSYARSAPRLLPPQQPNAAGRPGLSHHASPGRLPGPGCGVATCSTRTISMAGLSPAGSQPCRPLPNALGSSLGYGRQIARSARDAGCGQAAASEPRGVACAPTSGCCAGCGAAARCTSAMSPLCGTLQAPRCCRVRRSSCSALAPGLGRGPKPVGEADEVHLVYGV